MAPHIQVLAAKLDDPNSIPMTCVVEKEILTYFLTFIDAYIHLHTEYI